MFRKLLALAAALALASTAHAFGLPDTGQDTCYNDTVADGVAASDPASIARDAGTHPRQDCRYGRDAAAAAGQLTKTGAGDKGFDYSKIANDGTTLAAGAALGTAATDWACTKDNITGLTWEVKVNDTTHLRHNDHSYTWYSSDAATNGGNAGSTGANSCNATLPGNLCNTGAFVTAVNAAALCSYTDWRMPTRRELLTLIHAGRYNESDDPTYFPDKLGMGGMIAFWSGSSYAPDPTQAWLIMLDYGGVTATSKTDIPLYVRLVRGGQF